MSSIISNGTNIIIEVDQGKAGRGITNVTLVTVGADYYLEFDYTDGTTEQVGPIATVVTELVYAEVRNAEATTILKGQPVYLYQASGNLATVKLAYNTSDATSSKTLGLAAENIAAGAQGLILTQGTLAGVDTSAYSEGDTLYLGATPGTLTAVKPKAPNHLVYIGVVERANAGAGQIYVRVQNGFELDEIHDVQINSPANGQTIIYDASTSLWKNANLTAGAGITIVNGPGSVTISAPQVGTVTSVDASGGTTGMTFSGGPITASGTLTMAGTLAVANGGTGVTTSTGTGSVVLSTSPTLTTPNLGTPSAATLTNATGLPLTTGVTGTLPVANGGTNGTASPVAGAVAYGTGSAYAFTAAGTSNQVLISNGASAPTWSNLSSLGVTTFSAGTTGFTPSSATSGAVTLAGTLATTNGGTGLTSFTANGVVYASSTSALATGSALTFDGSRVFTVAAAANNAVIAATATTNQAAFLSAVGHGNTQGSTSFDIIQDQSFAYVFNRANTPMLFGVNNTEQMRLTSTGLGIGTSSPSAKLHIYEATAAATRIRVLANGGQQAALQLAGNGTTFGTTSFDLFQDGGNDAYVANRANASLQFWTNNTERMRLDPSGNLGLGVTPSAWLAGTSAFEVEATGNHIWGPSGNSLYVGSNAYYDSSWKYAATGLAATYQSAAGQHRWFTAPSGTAGNAISFTQAMTLDADGDLGIGTTSPGVRLDVNSGATAIVANFNSTNANGNYIRFQNSGTSNGDIGSGASLVSGGALADFGINVRGANNLILATNSTERARLDASGNLGLGVTPSAWNSSASVIEQKNGVAWYSFGVASNNTLVTNAFVNSGSSFIYKTSDFASSYQQISGQHIWRNAPSGTAGNAISFTQAMTLDASGNLGIGTTSPDAKLDVVVAAGLTAIFGSESAANAYTGWKYNSTTLGYVGNGAGVAAGGGATDFAIGSTGSRALVFGTNDTERMRLDASGNLGLGVTPSAWSTTWRALQVGGAAALWSSSGGVAGTYLNNNNYFDGTNRVYINNGYATEYAQFTGQHVWYTAPSGTAGNAISFTQAMTLDASGNLSIGTTGSLARIAVENSSAGDGVIIRSNGFNTNKAGVNNSLLLGSDYTSGISYVVAGGSSTNTTLAFYTAASAAPVERARITSGGDLLLGTTNIDPSGGNVNGAAIGNASGNYISITRSAAVAGTFNLKGITGDMLRFNYEGGVVGTISITTTSTAYNTSSDYRLKDNQQPLTGSGAFIDALQPKTWNWKTDGSKGVGFIAHEVQAVSPGSVVGEKDAVDADGKPVMQAMEYGSAEFIANIVAELQSLRARMAQLEAQP